MAQVVLNGNFSRRRTRPKIKKVKKGIDLTMQFEEIYQKGFELGHFSKDKVTEKIRIEFIYQHIKEFFHIPKEYGEAR